jgi:ribosomal protein L18
MKKTVGMCAWTVATLLVVATGLAAQESEGPKPAVAEETAGPRLRVRFLETRQRGEKTRTVPPCVVMLHPGDKGGYVFVGTQVALRTIDKGTQTVVFKNAGVQAKVSVQAQADGRYLLDASIEDGSVLETSGGATAPSNGDNPILQVVKGESKLVIRDGETVLFASAVDPVTGEVVRIDVAVDAAPAVKKASSAGSLDGRLRARFVLRRRQGDKAIANRPYSVLLQAGEEKEANVFGGAMLPLQVSHQGQPTVMLKDVGAGVKLDAHRIRDGRYRIDLSVSDGTLVAAGDSPRLQVFQAESRLYVQEGETVVVASAADPKTGDVVEAEVTIEAVR